MIACFKPKLEIGRKGNIMNSKKFLSGIVGVLLVIAMVAVLAGCVSMEQRVLTGMTKLQSAKAMQGNFTVDGTIGLDMMGTKQDVPIKMSMDMVKSGNDMSLKGSMDASAAGVSQQISVEMYTKDGSSYIKQTGQDKYTKTKAAASNIESNTMQLLDVLKDVDLSKAKFTYDKQALTVDGKSVQADKVKVALPDEETAKLTKSLTNSLLSNAGATMDTSAVQSIMGGMKLENFSLTLYLNGDNIIREESTMKLTLDLSKVAGVPAGTTGSMVMDMNLGFEITKVADTLPLTFPEFNDSNTVSQ